LTGTIELLHSGLHTMIASVGVAKKKYMYERHRARKLKTPDHLYRYRAFSTHNVDALTENSVWLSTPKSFNDPFDCALSLDALRFGESLAHAVEEAVRHASDLPPTAEQLVEHPGDREAFETFRLNLLESQQSRGVLSLTEVPDSLLMWAHYGDSHKGFCIEYDAVGKSELSNLARPVNYVDALPSLTAGDIFRGSSGDALDELWLTKARC